MNIRKGLKSERDKNKLTQKQVAKILFIDTKTYCQYELEQRKIPLDLIEKLANYYDTTIDKLIVRNYENL